MRININNIADLEELPSYKNKVTFLIARDLKLNTFPDLSDYHKLVFLNLSFNNLTTLPALPSGLKTLAVHHNKLTTLPELPTTLEKVVIYGNQITKLELRGLRNLQMLLAQSNYIAEINLDVEYPELKIFNLRNNLLREVPTFNPASKLTEFSISNNLIRDGSDILFQNDLQLKYPTVKIY